jgi:hypothetical protein
LTDARFKAGAIRERVLSDSLVARLFAFVAC